MKHFTYIFLFICLFSFQEFSAQNNSEAKEEKLNTLFTVRGEVRGYERRTPISNAVIRIVGGEQTKTNKYGRFSIRARVGDQLIIEHESFGREYHTITSDERIDVVVEGFDKQLIEARRG